MESNATLLTSSSVTVACSLAAAGLTLGRGEEPLMLPALCTNRYAWPRRDVAPVAPQFLDMTDGVPLSEEQTKNYVFVTGTYEN